MKTRKLEEIGDWVNDTDLKIGVWCHYKGHNIPKDVLQKELEDDWLDYVHWDNDGEKYVEILDTEEDYYYFSRYYEGSDAQEHGFNHWFNQVVAGKQKRTHGKCTNVKFRIKQLESEK